MENLVSKATKAAIRHAKYRKSPKVNKDDLLVGILQVISRFDIVQIGQLTIDLEDFQGISRDGYMDEPANISNQKVAYSDSANAIFEKAASIARKDNSPKVEIVHLLVAFADENNELIVVDHKTAVRPKIQQNIDSDLQFSAYSSLLASNRFTSDATAPVKCRMDVLRKLKKPKVEIYHTVRTAADRRVLPRQQTL